MAGDAQRPGELITGINVTPLVDVVLVLLIIMMVAAPIVSRQSLPLALPEAKNAEPAQNAVVRVVISRDLRFRLDERVVTREQAVEQLARMAKDAPGLRLSISADEGVPWGEVARFLDAARGAGVRKVAADVRPARAP
ncbi:MAG: biopolymer transporter ExbD [Elusimicrobiota bacterium]|nr:biopolymer transporter ExbD [Elusimicrobiota bacterium]